MVLAPFAETKWARLPGRNPATQKSAVIRDFGKKGATHSPTYVLDDVESQHRADGQKREGRSDFKTLTRSFL